MAERAIARKSQLFLNSVLPVVDTHDEVVKKRFKKGKFIFTYAGIVKILALFFLLIGWVLFLSISLCDDAPNWYPYLFPAATGLTFCTSLSLLMVFSYGIVVKKPGFWVHLDIFSSLLLAIFTLISTILSMDACKMATPLQKVPEPLTITGSILLIIDCAILFLLYRYKEEDEDDNFPQVAATQEVVREGVPPRKSVFA